jgi:hypothetical protein
MSNKKLLKEFDQFISKIYKQRSDESTDYHFDEEVYELDLSLGYFLAKGLGKSEAYALAVEYRYRYEKSN